MPPLRWKSSRLSPQPHWKTATSTPYAAPTESRLSTIALIGITSDRNETSRSRNAKQRTKAKTSGADDFIFSFQSFDPAVVPVTATSTPGSLPTVAGMISVRSVSSARSTSSSVPSPTSGMSTRIDLAVGRRLDVDRLEHLAGGERLPLQLRDRRLDGRVGRVAP